MSEPHGLWVRSDVLPTGAYGVSINVGEDRAWTLTPERAVAYAVTCVRRATEAEHDTAVLSLLQSVGVDKKGAQTLLTEDLWPDRFVDHVTTEPLRFHSGVSRRRRTGELVATLRMDLDGQPAGELTTADLRDHALGVLKVVAAVDLDAALMRCLTVTVGTDHARAAQIVHGLKDHWPAEDSPRSAGGVR